MSENATTTSCKLFLDRREAAEYLTTRGLKTAPATLAKYACLGGGPVFQSFGRFPRYTPEELDRWVRSRLSAPRRSTLDVNTPSCDKGNGI